MKQFGAIDKQTTWYLVGVTFILLSATAVISTFMLGMAELKTGSMQSYTGQLFIGAISGTILALICLWQLDGHVKNYICMEVPEKEKERQDVTIDII